MVDTKKFEGVCNILHCIVGSIWYVELKKSIGLNFSSATHKRNHLEITCLNFSVFTPQAKVTTVFNSHFKQCNESESKP